MIENLFRRSRSETEAESAAKPGGKGRPTPTRKEAQAAAKARARAPRNRKEANKRAREARGEDSRKIRQAMKDGDERYLLPRDKGPMRRFVRDYVDTRFSIVEMIIPLLVISLVLGWSGQPDLMQASTMVMMATVLFVIVDLVVLRFRLRKELVRRFPGESFKGTTFYASMRALQMKFMRLPKAQVKFGQELPKAYY